MFCRELIFYFFAAYQGTSRGRKLILTASESNFVFFESGGKVHRVFCPMYNKHKDCFRTICSFSSSFSNGIKEHRRRTK